MKRILFSLLILAIYASANTCTEKWLEALSFRFIAKKDAAHLDSIYYKEYDNEWSNKYVYGSNNQLDHIIFHLDDSEPIAKFYFSKDEGVLTKKGEELLISDSIAGDTLYFTQKVYRDGEIYQSIFHKTTDRYTSELSYDPRLDLYDFNELFFRNDTLIERVVKKYNTDSAEVSFIYYVEDPSDDTKCYEYQDELDKDSPDYTIIYNKNSQGFSLKYFDQKFTREMFMIYPDGTTAIRKLRPTVKISPKARYFDLLGRYKYSK
jgi:hypothetical protein